MSDHLVTNFRLHSIPGGPDRYVYFADLYAERTGEPHRMEFHISRTARESIPVETQEGFDVVVREAVEEFVRRNIAPAVADGDDVQGPHVIGVERLAHVVRTAA